MPNEVKIEALFLVEFLSFILIVSIFPGIISNFRVLLFKFCDGKFIAVVINPAFKISL